MSVISKQLAEQIAKKMTEKSRKAVDSLNTQYRTLATDLYEATVPKEVMQLFEKHSEYIETTLSLYADGHGFNRESVSMVRRLPATESYSVKLELNAKNADRLLKLKHKHENASKKYKILFQETEQALLTLKTYNNIRKELPEAAPYLPPPLSNALVVNFTSLKERLSKQPDLETVTA